MITDLGSDRYLVELDPLSFTVQRDLSKADRLLIEDFYSAPAGSGLSVHISGNINWSLNGGSEISIPFNTNNGVFAGTSGIIDSNDLFFNFSLGYLASGAGIVNTGDVVTLSTSNMIFEKSSLGLPPQPGPFTAHLLFLGTSIATANVSLGLEAGQVPEPATLTLFGLGLAGLGFARRKQAGSP